MAVCVNRATEGADGVFIPVFRCCSAVLKQQSRMDDGCQAGGDDEKHRDGKKERG